jgi:LPPG:FO 2-phospho-L-lactate transferase
VTRELSQRLGIGHAIVPMSDEPVRTIADTDEGELAFQHYFVKRRCEPRVRGFRYNGAERARPPASLAALIESGSVTAAIICPSNPYISVEPVLRVAAIREWLDRRAFPVVAVSPIIGGEAVKGPAAKMMRELAVTPSAFGVAEHYGPLVDGWVIDHVDAALEARIAAMGKAVAVTRTLMTDRARSTELARTVLDLAEQVKPRRTR